MKPLQHCCTLRNSAHPRVAFALALICCTALAGCTDSLIRSRSQSPGHGEGDESDSQTKLVGDYAYAYGTNFVRVEGPVLVTGLAGTGSDPPPGPQRSALMFEMQARNVENPAKILASPTTSMAWAIAYLPPGVRKGDKLDIEVRVPPGSETTSIAGGWMMQTRLKEMAMLAGQVHEGHIMAIGEGPVMVDPIAHTSDDPVALTHGIVLGGGVALKDRTMGLVLPASEKSVFRSKQIGDAINRRFHVFLRGVKQGVATPKTDEYIELEIHPRYKHNLSRYLRVVRSIPLDESPEQELARLDLLERQLLDPVTSATAAIRLEAVGKDGVRVLKKGLESKDPEVRFYAAEALAYLDEAAAVPALAEAARSEPAFRAFALAALSALDDIHSADALRDLFDVTSAETRYGAFRALWAMNENDPQLRGEHLQKKFWLHVVPSSGPPMVHVTHSFRPEIVVFGEGQRFNLPMALEAGNSIIIKSLDDGQISIAKFSTHEADQRRTVANTVEDVVRGIAEVGGDYPDAVQAIQQACTSGSLSTRFEVDAIPQRGRIYDRNRKLARGGAKNDETATAILNAGAASDTGSGKSGGSASADGHGDESSFESSQPLPDLFGGGAPKPSADDPPHVPHTPENSEKSTPPRKSFWDKMMDAVRSDPILKNDE